MKETLSNMSPFNRDNFKSTCWVVSNFVDRFHGIKHLNQVGVCLLVSVLGAAAWIPRAGVCGGNDRLCALRGTLQDQGTGGSQGVATQGRCIGLYQLCSTYQLKKRPWYGRVAYHFF